MPFNVQVGVETSVPKILTFDKFAAPTKVILPSPTVTTISDPLFIDEKSPAMLSVELALNPKMVLLPSPILYLIMLFCALPSKNIVSSPAPAEIVTLEPALAIWSFPNPVSITTF